jgi:hypothetical protein
MRGLALAIALGGLRAEAIGAAGGPPPPAPQTLPRTSAAIVVDGDLGDPGWRDALVIDRFYETTPGDNIPAKVKTTAFLTYDGRYFYIGIKADDPEPAKIRAPYVERDNVIGTDDNIAVFLDTRNDKRTAMEIRVNPRGIQGDFLFDDASGSEDESPDFFYDTAAKITAEGWQAEFRVPLTTLRYPETDPQTWGIIIWRNYPRDFRYGFYSVPIERGSNCVICHTQELTGITGLPSSHHLVAAPYATASRLEHREDPADPGSPFVTDPVDRSLGLDVKWSPGANSAIDATINPDFSQVESDVPQILENQRFALFFPEKRPFFLEGSDLLNSPIQIVYTRTVTDPQWGLRVTGKTGSTSYTVLAAEDQGGGLVVLPGPAQSAFAPQDFRSTVALGRVRRDFGLSFASLMFTDREISGGGHNRVLGPDAQWRPTPVDTVTGQVLYSHTENPDRPALDPSFDGRSAASHAGTITWDHQERRHDWRLRYNDLGDGFRADDGFVPQVGYREGLAAGGLRFYPTGLLNFVRGYAVADKFYLPGGEDLGHDYYPGLFFLGSRNLQGQFERHDNEVKVGDLLLTQRFLTYFLQFDPGRRFPRLTLQGRLGDLIDFDNGRVGRGTNVSLEATVRPFVHLTLVADGVREWLDLDRGPARGRLYTARIERLRAVYVFGPRAFLRLIGQYVTTDRDPALYAFPVPARDGTFLASLLYSYRLNWQTALFLGYGDDGVVTETHDLAHTDRSIFLKLSYAFQH